MNRSLALVAALAACDRASSAPATAAPDAAPPLAVPATSFAPPSNPSHPISDACGFVYPLTSGKSVGHTSLVFKIELSDGSKLAWKPNAKKVKNRWRGEVAAYRLAVGLGIAKNVPPACSRRFGMEAAQHAVPPHALDDAIDDKGELEGAVIPWINGLQFWALEKDPLRAEVRGWLSAKMPAPSGDKADLARQASMLVVFDAITGNWDRYSGGNVGLDETGKTVLFIDNDAAFMEGPPKERLKENEALLAQTDRFSKSFVGEVRKLDEARLGEIIGTLANGHPLLEPARVAEAAKRAADAVKTIDAKIAARSEAVVLAFP